MSAPMNKEKGQELILELGEILDTLGIRFWLFQGTALGVYRDDGFTPSERDIDIAILYPEFADNWDRLESLLLEHFYDTELFVAPFTKPRTMCAWKCGIKADIVSLIPFEDKLFTIGPIRPWDKKPYSLVHNARFFKNAVTKECWGREWRLPNPIEEYLKSEYGRGWRVPKDSADSLLRDPKFLERNSIVTDRNQPSHYLEQFEAKNQLPEVE